MSRPLADPPPKEILERGLGERFGRPVCVVRVEEGSADIFSSHPIRRLRVHLDSGETMPVVFKRIEADGATSREREVFLYERLLAGKRFGAPELYASHRDERRGLYWLFLEDVGDLPLEWCETEEWPAAFRWMARMHAETSAAEDELLSLGCLEEHGPRFYCDLMDSARRSLRRSGEPDALLRFDALTKRYFWGTVSHLARQPRTLVHGDASCHNLMVEGGGIRPVDWEWAAVGHPAWDVAKLLSGWGEERERFIEVYLDEFEKHAPLDRGEFLASLEHCRVLHAMWYLWWWISACEDPAFVCGLLDKMERAWEGRDG
jgi:hypothetical protein